MKDTVVRWDRADDSPVCKDTDARCYACVNQQVHSVRYHHQSIHITKRLGQIQAPNQLTIAVRICAGCNTFLGVARWEGPAALPDEDWTISHGLCDVCVDKVGRAVEEAHADAA